MSRIRARVRRLFLRTIQLPPFLFLFKVGVQIIHYFGQFHSKNKRQSIKNLDEILARAGTLEQFLGNAALKEDYYQALSNYFSSRNVSRGFPRKSYDALMGQIDLLARNLPGFSARAWRKNASKVSFKFSTREQNTGRSLNLLAWRMHRHQWISGLEQCALDLTRPQVRSILIATVRKIRAFEDEVKAAQIKPSSTCGIKHLNRKSVKIIRNSFYSNLMEDPDLKRVAARFLHSYLTHSQNKIFYDLIDADLIIHYLLELRQNPRVTIPGWLDAPIPNALLSLIKNSIPSTQSLLNDRIMFPCNNSQIIRARSSEYQHFSVRPFHGLWTGIFAKDCLAGDDDYLPLLTPNRWAVALLEGAETEFLERNGRYQGFVRTVPINHFKEGLLHNLEVWVPIMSRSVIKMHVGGDFPPRQTALFEQWFESWMGTELHRHRKIVVSNSRIVDNERVKDAIFNSRAFRDGQEVGRDLLGVVGDYEFMKGVNKLFPRSCAADKYYQTEVAIDATLRDAYRLRCLGSPCSPIRAKNLNQMREINV